MKIKKSIQINTSRDLLWIWLTDTEKMKKWNPTIVREEAVSPGEAKTGFQSRVLIKEGSKEIWYDSEILEYNPETALRIVLSGGHLGKHPMEVDYGITEGVGHLLLNIESRWKPSGVLLHLLYPLIKMKATGSTVKLLSSLKAQIENRS